MQQKNFSLYLGTHDNILHVLSMFKKELQMLEKSKLDKNVGETQWVEQHLQWLAKVFMPLELFHILSRYNHKRKCILLGFYVIDQHEVAHNCEVEGKLYMVFKFYYK